MEKDEQRIRDMVNEWLLEDPDNRFRDVDELTQEYAELIVDSEGLENFGYTEADKDEVFNIVSDVVMDFIGEVNIYEVAEEYDGNMAHNYLGESEWQEIFENAPDTFIEALHAREAFVRDSWGEIPDLVWEELEENVRDHLGFINYTPEAIIDNVIVNGSYGDFDDFKDENETDEEFIAREEDNCFRIYPEERFIIYSL